MKERRGRRQPAQTVQPHTWPSAATFHRIRQLNEKFFTGVARRAVEVGVSNQQLWNKMDARACKRAAGAPVLLVDMWLPGQARRRSPRRHECYLSAEQAPGFLREILVEACMIARSDPLAASLVFDMPPAVTASVAALTASDIDQIVADNSHDLQPRWKDNTSFWTRLLLAAIGENDQLLSQVHLHSLQLLGTEPLPLCG